MARTMTTVGVGRVNRRLLLLALLLAVLSAVFVYVGLSRSGEDGAGAGSISVVVATQEVPAGTRLTADMVELRSLPSSAVGEQPLRDVDDVVGKVALYPIAANEPLLLSNVVGVTDAATNDVLRNIIEGGKRAMAIETKAVIGAGGLVLPGDRVDIYWVPGKAREEHEGAVLIAENVEVLAVRQTLVDIAPTAPGVQQGEEGSQPGGTGTNQRVPGSTAEPIPDASTVTLMLAPDQAARVFCAETSGSLRLAVRAFGDESPAGVAPGTCIIEADESADQPAQ